MPNDPTGEVAPEPSQLVAAVCAVMAEVGYVRGTGRNTQQGYGYVSDADLLRPLQAAMAEHGLMLCPVGVEVRDTEWKSPKGKLGLLTDVLVRYTLRHRDGEVISIQTPGRGWNVSDKGVYSAMTGAFKYCLRQTFAIPSGDDAEKDRPRSRDDQPAAADPEDRARLQKLWYATLGRLAADNLTPQLCTDERRLVQVWLWGVKHLADLDGAGCGHHLNKLRRTDDGRLAAEIRRIIGADPQPEGNPT